MEQRRSRDAPLESVSRKNEEQLQPVVHKKCRVSLTNETSETLDTAAVVRVTPFSTNSTLSVSSPAVALDEAVVAVSPAQWPMATTGPFESDGKTDTEPLSDTSAEDEGQSTNLESMSDSQSDDSDDDSLNTVDRDQEDALVHELVHAVFAPHRRDPRQRRAMNTFVRWISNPNCTLDSFRSLRDPLASSSLARPPVVPPMDHLQAMLRAAHYPGTILPASSLGSFFEPVTMDYVRGYTLDVARAVRADDVAALVALQDQGRLVVPCGTKYGDSILHTACRRQCQRVVHFLLTATASLDPPSTVGSVGRDDAPRRGTTRVSVRLQNQCGRTPLTDCCWTTRPSVSWHAAVAVLTACPDLLYVSDRHGSTPLDYVPPMYWNDWCRFLDQMGADRLAARTIHGDVAKI